jgi:hypothetical protein
MKYENPRPAPEAMPERTQADHRRFQEDMETTRQYITGKILGDSTVTIAAFLTAASRTPSAMTGSLLLEDRQINAVLPEMILILADAMPERCHMNDDGSIGLDTYCDRFPLVTLTFATLRALHTTGAPGRTLQ